MPMRKLFKKKTAREKENNERNLTFSKGRIIFG